MKPPERIHRGWLLLLLLAACHNRPPTPVTLAPELIQAPQHLVDDTTHEAGRRYALQHCQACHRFVEPALLPRSVWSQYVLPRMGGFLGMHHAGYDYTPQMGLGNSAEERTLIRNARLYPEQPLVPSAQWDTLVAYLLANAPDTLPVSPRPARRSAALRFRAVTWPFRREQPMTTLVQIDEARQQVFIGDMLRQSLTVLRPDGTEIAEMPLGNAPVAIRRQQDALWVTSIGSVLPSDVPSGEVVVLRRTGDTYRFYPGDRKLHRLQRPVATRYEDLNEDGIEDLIVSEYGNQLGRLVWYEGRADGTYAPHVLSNDPGSMASEVVDLNGDGWKDVAVIFGQNREGIQVFYNLGDGRFQPSHVVQLPPCYGSSHFQFFDFDADGHLDILATNGDNGDYPPVLKPYHGVRIWRNDGHNRFEERYFFPLHGAFKALAGDFDGDRDADIVAIAMFPDFEHHPEDGFVYLENQGNLRFEAATLPEAATGRWLTMDAGDLDGDGDRDVVLGAFVQGPGKVPEVLAAQWQRLQRPVLYLENLTR